MNDIDELKKIEYLHNFELDKPKFFVYFLINKDKIVYIGKTSRSPFNRISAHKKNLIFKEMYYIEVDSPISALNSENYYISKFKPKYNKTYPFEVELEPKNKLEVYLRLTKKTKAQAAKELTINRQYLHYILTGKAIPGRKLAQRIREWSDGAVSFDDLWK